MMFNERFRIFELTEMQHFLLQMFFVSRKRSQLLVCWNNVVESDDGTMT